MRVFSLWLEELRTDEKEEVNGEGEVLFGRADESSEGRLVDIGVSPRRALVPGAGKPQADCGPLTDCAPELLFKLEAIGFWAAG
jgi:hypothetical protein